MPMQFHFTLILYILDKNLVLFPCFFSGIIETFEYKELSDTGKRLIDTDFWFLFCFTIWKHSDGKDVNSLLYLERKMRAFRRNSYIAINPKKENHAITKLIFFSLGHIYHITAQTECLSPLTLWVRTLLRQGVLNTTLCDIKFVRIVTCDGSVVFYGFSGFFNQ